MGGEILTPRRAKVSFGADRDVLLCAGGVNFQRSLVPFLDSRLREGCSGEVCFRKLTCGECQL